jgi:oligopeptide/dipeptide ABC transporter ATP-binding protein
MTVLAEPRGAMTSEAEPVPLLSVRNLRIAFEREGSIVVDGVSFDVAPREIVGIVGESGSGKSLTARSILRLVPATATVSGGIRFQGEDVLAMTPERLRALRGAQLAMVFQDPMTSFNPVLRVGDQIQEAIAIHERSAGKSLVARVAALLARVGIANPRERARNYPHQFSGGMRQRALTAMAAANAPALLIADEPTTALDVTVQDQILRLMRDLNQQSGTAILLITHNIAVVASLCQRVIVMYSGRVVEDGPVATVFASPRHPYTKLLLRSVPRIHQAPGRLVTIDGQPPDPAFPPPGCRFSPRCPWVRPSCEQREPTLDVVDPGHHARCDVPIPGTMS